MVQMDYGSRRPDLATSSWWRFSDYELTSRTDGVVRPTAGATAEPYDPWAEYIDGRRRGVGNGRRLAPYQELVSLWYGVRQRDLYGTYSDLDSRQERRLIDWCRRCGLLGLWHHEVLLALFPEASQGSRGNRLRGYQRVPWGWGQVSGVADRDLPPRGAPRGARLPDEYLATLPHEVWRGALPDGGFVVRELAGGQISHAPLRPTWRLYFDPQGPLSEPTWPMPAPNSLKFMQSYGEAVAMIMFAAQELELAIEHLAADGASGRESRERLNALAAPAAPALVETAEGLTLGWDSPSLLASLATMAITDVIGGARPVVCQWCGAPFLTKAYKPRYCSDRCQETAHTRRRRDKEKKKAE